jgi:hypothetical protein
MLDLRRALLRQRLLEQLSLIDGHNLAFLNMAII